MDVSGIASAGKGLFLTIMKVLIIVIVAGAGFFGSRSFIKHKKRMNTFRINAFLTNPDGSHMSCRIGKFKDKDKMQKMLFLRKTKSLFGITSWQIWKGETMSVINPKNIVNLSVHLFRYGPSQYAVIPPEVYRTLNIDDFKIQLINMHMLEFKGLEQRAGISRWAAIKKSLQEWAPWITLGIIALCAGVSIYFIVKMGMTEFAKVTAARVVECKTLIGGGSTPLS